MTLMTRDWSDPDAFSRCIGKSIVVTPDGVALRRGMTVADEIGNCNDRDREHVAGLRQTRKVFVIPRVETDRVVLCPYLDCDHDGGELDVLVNGHPTRIRWRKDRPYWEDRWTPVEIPVHHLQSGENECVFRAVGDAQWTLLIENSRQPNRSSVSEDGGQTWRSEDLGVNNRTDGEYMIRLWLDQHHRSAECCSEPIDVLALNQVDVNQIDANDIAVDGRLSSCKVLTECDTPPNTSISLFTRGGSTPSYDPNTWSAWHSVDGEVTFATHDRFLQWRAVLETDDPSLTPVLKAVHLTATLEINKEPVARVTNAQNPDLVRSPYRFAHMSADDERGQLLRERWNLNDVVRDAKTDFDRFLHLRQWVREQWEDGWNTGGIDFCPPWDAPLILELASQKLSLGMCTHYATVMSQCSAALGLVARTQIMRSHCINEVWSGDHDKWVAMDVGGDTNDETKFTYHFEREGVPLSALDCHEAWVNEDYENVNVVPQPPAATDERFEVANRLRLFERFMISLRNDETTTMGPGEPEHGKGSYHYDGYLFWQDEKTDPLPWFSQHTSRREDLNWSVNRLKIHLQQGDSPDRLQVLLDVEMPNLDRFEFRIDKGEWETCLSAFDWSLTDGENRIDVRPVNAFGRQGASSWVVVTV